jgi:hypothetical protein
MEFIVTQMIMIKTAIKLLFIILKDLNRHFESFSIPRHIKDPLGLP